MYRIDNICDEYKFAEWIIGRYVYNVTITDQWPQEGFDIDVEFPIEIEELPA